MKELGLQTIAIGAIDFGDRLRPVDDAHVQLLAENILQTGLLGRKTREWSKDEIDHVTVGNSNISVNNRPLPELQIHLQSGAKRGLLAGRDRADLQWIASAITRTMRLSSR